MSTISFRRLCRSGSAGAPRDASSLLSAPPVFLCCESSPSAAARLELGREALEGKGVCALGAAGAVGSTLGACMPLRGGCDRRVPGASSGRKSTLYFSTAQQQQQQQQQSHTPGTALTCAARTICVSSAEGMQPIPILLASRESVSSSSLESLPSRDCCSPFAGVRTRTGASFHTWCPTRPFCKPRCRTHGLAREQRRPDPTHQKNRCGGGAYPLVLHNLFDVEAVARPGRVKAGLNVLGALDQQDLHWLPSQRMPSTNSKKEMVMNSRRYLHCGRVQPCMAALRQGQG